MVDWPAFSTDSQRVEETRHENTYTDAKTGLVMIRIPTGEFFYGEEKRLEYLPEYWIAKTPGTNAHYLRFVRATGHEPPEHWGGKSPKAAIRLCMSIIMMPWVMPSGRACFCLLKKSGRKLRGAAVGVCIPGAISGVMAAAIPMKQGLEPRPRPGGIHPKETALTAVWIWRAMCESGRSLGLMLLRRGGLCAAVRGTSIRSARAASRNSNHPALRYNAIGFRLVVRHPPSR